MLSSVIENIITNAIANKQTMQSQTKALELIQYLDIETTRLFRQTNQPAGFRNIGNTCYFNVFLQILYNLVPFRNFILSLQLPTMEKQLIIIRNNQKQFQLIYNLQLLFAEKLYGKLIFVDPSPFFHRLKAFKPQLLALGRQNDLYEFITFIMECLQESLRVIGKKANIVSSFFYGELKNEIIYEQIQKISYQKFSIITLQPQDSDLVHALDKYLNQYINDYVTDNGKKVTATSISSFNQLPEILSFHINRVGYGPQGFFKKQNKFTFEKHLDIKHLQSKQPGLTSLKHLTQQINNLKKGLSNPALDNIKEKMDEIKRYMKSQKQIRFSKIQDNVIFFKKDNDLNIGMIVPENEMSVTVKVLERYSGQLQNQKKQLQKKISKLQESKQKLLKQSPQIYSIFGIMIHKGEIAYGHYYCIIWDQISEMWIKYNDMKVDVITQKQAFEIAQGIIYQNTSSCCLFYKHSKIHVSHNFKDKITASLKRAIAQKEKSICQRIDYIKLQRIVNTIIDSQYQRKFQSDFIAYFLSPANYYLGKGQHKIAAVLSAIQIMKQASFQTHLDNSMINKQKICITGKSVPIATAFGIAKNIIVQTLKHQQQGEYRKCLQILFHGYTTIKKQFYMDVILINTLSQWLYVFLLKSCFYIELLMQRKQQSLNQLISVIAKIASTIQFQAPLRNQIFQNINSLKYFPIELNVFQIKCESIEHLDRNYSNLSKNFRNSSKVWINFWQRISKGQVIKQQQRINLQLLQFPNYMK